MEPNDDSKMTDVQRGICRMVRMLLARDDVKKQDLAEVLGIHPTSMSRSFEDSDKRRNWKVEDIKKMSVFFEVPETFFFEEDDLLDKIRKS